MFPENAFSSSPEATHDCWGNLHGTLDLGTTRGAGGVPSQAGISRRRKKARRSCLSCQQSHRACGDGRPCNTCIDRGIGHKCFDGVRKKPKYLEEDSSSASSLVRFSQPFANSNETSLPFRHDEQQDTLQRDATPGSCPSLLHSRHSGSTDSETGSLLGTQPSPGFSTEENTSTTDSNNPAARWSTPLDTHSYEDLITMNVLDQPKAVAESDLGAELDALNTKDKIGFAIEAGWCDTFV